MTSKKRGGLHFFGERIASWLTAAVRSSWAPVAAISALVVAGVVGFVLGFSEKYVVVIETGISVITFLLVLFLERTQHKESQAIQLKLNEIVAALEGASNRLIGVENVTE